MGGAALEYPSTCGSGGAQVGVGDWGHLHPPGARRTPSRSTPAWGRTATPPRPRHMGRGPRHICRGPAAACGRMARFVVERLARAGGEAQRCAGGPHRPRRIGCGRCPGRRRRRAGVGGHDGRGRGTSNGRSFRRRPPPHVQRRRPTPRGGRQLDPVPLRQPPPPPRAGSTWAFPSETDQGPARLTAATAIFQNPRGGRGGRMRRPGPATTSPPPRECTAAAAVGGSGPGPGGARGRGPTSGPRCCTARPPRSTPATPTRT